MSRAETAVIRGAETDQDEADQAGQPLAGRSLSGDKAQRIIEAMRKSVARRGAAGSTFDHVSREAGVSRGLLHYYFGTKEQLLVEAVRRDCEVRMERLQDTVSQARTVDDFIALMVQRLEETVRQDPDYVTLVFEMFTLSRRNPEVADEYAELMRRTRGQLAEMLAVAEGLGIIHLHAEPDAVAEILFALADGFALRMLSEPEKDFASATEAGKLMARALFGD
jgi:AcrR family transcriptional regulator